MLTTRHPALITLALVAIHASPLLGQQPSPSGPLPEATEDSARWWTLTDAITPEKLRAIHQDVHLHNERYLDAVRAGKQPPLPKEGSRRLRFFIDGSTDPELFQMWSVFASFAAEFKFGAVDPRVRLAEFGLESELVDKIADISIEYWNKREKLQEWVDEEMKAVEEMIRLSKDSLGPESYDVAIKTRDARMVANATGYSVEKVERLLRLWWEEAPADDLTIETLPMIKEALGPTDWERFRSYLLKAQAPNMSAFGFTEDEEG